MENIVSVDGLNIDLPDRRLFENLAFDIPRGALTCKLEKMVLEKQH